MPFTDWFLNQPFNPRPRSYGSLECDTHLNVQSHWVISFVTDHLSETSTAARYVRLFLTTFHFKFFVMTLVTWARESAYQIIPMLDFTLGPDASFKGRTRRQVEGVRASAPGQAHRFNVQLVEFVYTEWGGVPLTKYRNNLTCTPKMLALNS